MFLINSLLPPPDQQPISSNLGHGLLSDYNRVEIVEYMEILEPASNPITTLR